MVKLTPMKTVYHVLKILVNVLDHAVIESKNLEKNATIDQKTEKIEYVHQIVKTLIRNITVEIELQKQIVEKNVTYERTIEYLKNDVEQIVKNSTLKIQIVEMGKLIQEKTAQLVQQI